MGEREAPVSVQCRIFSLCYDFNIAAIFELCCEVCYWCTIVLAAQSAQSASPVRSEHAETALHNCS